MRKKSNRCEAFIICVVLLLAHSANADNGASLSGHLGVSVQGLGLGDAGSIVVFLEPMVDTPVLSGSELPTAALRQNGARFEPSFLALAVDQLVDMPNEDVIFHNVFSYSEPNSFDLGMYPSGESKSRRFEHAGLVRIYCSIHSEMDATVFVAPTRLFAVPDSTGRYVIEGIPPGDYRLHAWSMRFPEIVRPIDISGGGSLKADLELGSSTD